MKPTSVNFFFFVTYDQHSYLNEYHSNNSNEANIFSKKNCPQDSLKMKTVNTYSLKWDDLLLLWLGSSQLKL